MTVNLRCSMEFDDQRSVESLSKCYDVSSIFKKGFIFISF